VVARKKKAVGKQTSTRRVRYSVAVSLDGFIAGPKGEYDWITRDSSVDLAAFFREFDTLLMGRRTFELVQKSQKTMPGMQVVVFSRTLTPGNKSGVTISDNLKETVAALKAKAGKDIWLFGGGELFRSLLDAHLVDTVEVAVMPVLLSQGVPVLPAGVRSPSLKLIDSSALPSGIVRLTYTVRRAKN